MPVVMPPTYPISIEANVLKAPGTSFDAPKTLIQQIAPTTKRKASAKVTAAITNISVLELVSVTNSWLDSLDAFVNALCMML